MSRYIRAVFLLLLIAGIISSCKKKTPEDIGLPLLPGEDLLNAEFTDTLTLIAHTVKDDSLKTDETSPMLLGNVNDPIFGITQASIFTQLSIPSGKTNPSFGSNPVLDSAVLSLVYSAGQYYGNLTPQKFEVYELSDTMSTGASYYSNQMKPYYTTQQIGSEIITPDVKDSVFVDTVKQLPQLRVHLDKNLFQNFLDTSSSYGSSYISTAAFQIFFKGIYVKSSTTGTSGDGAIMYIDMTHTYSRLTLFYHNDSISTPSAFSYYFGISKTECARFSHFDHDYSSSADITAQLNSAYTIAEDNVYVQPMAGVRAKITFPYINDFFRNGKVAINKAELILPVEPNSITGQDSMFAAHSKLIATVGDSLLHILPDYFEGSNYFGGTYDASKKEYKFNIARYVQQVLNGTRENEGLYIITNARPTTSNRVQLIGGNKAFSPRMRLRITYTPLE